MERLRCGVILTDAFLAHLQDLLEEGAPAHPGQVLAIDYIRCRDGERAGQSWLEWFWVSRKALTTEHCFFRIPSLGAEVYLSPQSQQGLKNRFIDFRKNAVFVG